ncbi:MAG: hypothetical protein J6A23_15065, partial [Thermoguttaceae bacterium]|nr:hypothetical protein [Thermoguttaceae bacterium]
MKVWKFSITLHSDAQLGTGLGCENVNDHVPRGMNGRPLCPGAHLKGLMRESLLDIFGNLGLDAAIVQYVLGSSFDVGKMDAESEIKLTDAAADEGTGPTLLVTRTALDEYGTAKETSLRTDEAVRTGTVFRGKVLSNLLPASLEECVWQLGLLSIFAIGGNRNRGCGQCSVKIHDLESKPGDLLKRLEQEVPHWKTPTQKSSVKAPEFSETWVPVRLTFRADAPVCVPATAAAVKTNVQTTDFSIPASAVRGMIIRRFEKYGSEFMDQLFESPRFLAWPLQPVGVAGECEEKLKPNSPVSIRVSLTHRAAKFTIGDALKPEFQDKAWDEDLPQNAAPKAPMKASDGVLLVRDDESCPQLWKARSMPHDIRSHGVHRNEAGNPERGLYTVDSMAPMVWRGLVLLPKNLANELIESFKTVSECAFGSRRSVQGMGEITAEIVDEPAEWKLSKEAQRTVFIVQSPVSIPYELHKKSADEQLHEMAKKWLENCGVSASELNVWANTGVLFGWNVKRKGQQAPQLVILPGSVIQLQEKLSAEKIRELLECGFFLNQSDPQRGYGAVSVHPGKAVRLFERKPKREVLNGDELRRTITEQVLKMFSQNHHLPSPSQVRSLRKIYAVKTSQEAKEYFNAQIKNDTTWQAWLEIKKTIDEWLKQPEKEKETVLFGLELLA